MQEPPSEDMVQGPFAPDSMIPKFGLDSAQGDQYRAAWDSMMTATRPQRDSIHAAMGGMQRARAEGYSREGERQGEVLGHLGKSLEKAEERFDKVICRFLTNDQWEDFKDWRKRRRETEKELRRQRIEEEGPGGMRGGGPGGRRPRG